MLLTEGVPNGKVTLARCFNDIPVIVGGEKEEVARRILCAAMEIVKAVSRFQN